MLLHNFNTFQAKIILICNIRLNLFKSCFSFFNFLNKFHKHFDNFKNLTTTKFIELIYKIILKILTLHFIFLYLSIFIQIYKSI